MKILIADHDPVSRRISELIFDAWGHDVITAQDTARVLEILQASEAPSLVISDSVMPDWDGLKLFRTIGGVKRREDAYLLYCYSNHT